MTGSNYIDCKLSLPSDRVARLRVADPATPEEPFFERLEETRLREILPSFLEFLAPETYGRKLFAAVLRKKVLASFHGALAIARRERKYLRFRLVLPSRGYKELHRLHWELLFDSELGDALGCSATTPFSRYVAATTEPPWPIEDIEDRPRVLVVTSSPTDIERYGLCPIDRSELQATIEDALGLSSMEFDFLEGAATRRRIHRRLIDGSYHAVHFHAHGVKTVRLKKLQLILENEDRTCDPTSVEDFSKVCMGSRSLRLAVLMTCHSGEIPESDPLSGLGPRLVHSGIPAVVAMRRSISVRAASRFTRRFYQRLATTGTIDAAVNEARLDLSLDDRESRVWMTPVLYMRLQDGQLWRIRTSARRVPAFLPFTVDRGLQERGFHRAVRLHRQRPARPLVCLVSGDDRQALDMFEERIEKEFLPAALDCRAGVSGYRLRCSPDVEEAGRLRRHFCRDLAGKFLGRTDGSIDEIHLALGQIHRPVLIHSHLVAEECRKPHDLLSAFLDFWADWPDLRHGQSLVVLLFVEDEHQHSAGKDPWSSFRSWRRDRRMRRFEQVFSDYEKNRPGRLTTAVLPRLENIPRGAVDHWACGEELRKYGDQGKLLREIKMFFQDWKSSMSTTAIPMEDLAKQLEMILTQNLDMGRSV